MTTRDHLIYRMQEVYVLQRDMLALLDSMIHESADAALRQVLQHQHEITQGQLEPLERALNVLGAQYTMEHSLFVPVYHEATSRFKHLMNPSHAQLDIHILLLLLSIVRFNMSAYQGDMELARALGEQDVTTLLRENLQRQVTGMEELAALAPILIQQEGGHEVSRAA